MMMQRCFHSHSFSGWKDLFLSPLLIAFCLLFVYPTPHATAADAEILVPKPGARVIARYPETHLILRQPGKREDIRIQVGKSRQYIKPVSVVVGETNFFMHYRIPLKEGMNRFQVVPGGQKLVMFFEKINSDLELKEKITRNTDRFHRDDTLPQICADCHDLKKAGSLKHVDLPNSPTCVSCHRNLVDRETWRHSTTTNRQCLSCHLQSTVPWRVGFPSESIQKICLNCHTTKSAWVKLKFDHGPFSIGGCTLCHDPHSGKYRFQLWAEGSARLCISCHNKMESLFSRKKGPEPPYVHDILLGSGCVPCHDPHATNERYSLHKPINQLCRSCHYGIASDSLGHPIAGHPVSASRELRRPDRKLTCTSCHDPHVSKFEKMLFETPLGGRLCSECHQKKTSR